MNYTTLKRSAEFKRVRGGGRVPSPLFVIEGKARPALAEGTPARVAGPRFGFTITRKVGNAVVRNRIRRRLKEALRLMEPGVARADYDYVVVANRALHDYPFAELQAALREALQRINRLAGNRAGHGGSARGSPRDAAARAVSQAVSAGEGADGSGSGERRAREQSHGAAPGHAPPIDARTPGSSHPEGRHQPRGPGAGGRRKARRITEG